MLIVIENDESHTFSNVNYFLYNAVLLNFLGDRYIDRHCPKAGNK